MAVKATTDGVPLKEGGSLKLPPSKAFKGTLVWRLKACTNITAGPSSINSGDVKSETLARNGSWNDVPSITTFYRYKSPSTGVNYSINMMAAASLPAYIGSMLVVTLIGSPFGTVISGTAVQTGFSYYQGDVVNIRQNLATTITNQIRNNNPGDNFNATRVAGRAFFNEMYIQVRWQWMILPLVEAALATFLLVVTVIITRGQPLFKTSVMAYLVSGLDGWNEEIPMPKPRAAQEQLENLAQGMVAQLEADRQGHLRFSRRGKWPDS